MDLVFDCEGYFAVVCRVFQQFCNLPDRKVNFEAKGLEIFAEKVSVGRLKQALETALERAMETVDLQENLRSQ